MVNLHDIVRPVITSLHPDETVTLFQFKGIANNRGRLVPNCIDPNGLQVTAQIQSMGSESLDHREDANRTVIERKAYLYAPQLSYASGTDLDTPKGIDRWYVRDGDFLQRSDGTWWLITALTEDFSRSGWVCVGITRQITPPNLMPGDSD